MVTEASGEILILERLGISILTAFSGVPTKVRQRFTLKTNLELLNSRL
jgi:hypothetical protein